MAGRIQKTNWKRVIVAVVLVVGGLWGAGTLVYHVETWRTARGWLRDNPSLAMVPRPLEKTGVAQIQHGVERRAHGFAVTFPATEDGTPEVALANKSKLTAIGWENHKSVLFMDSSASRMVLDMARAAPSFYGIGPNPTAYQVENAILNESGAEIGFFRSNATNLRASILLVQKMGTTIPSHQTALYALSFGQMRGFQVGEPSSDRTAQLFLFDSQDHELEMWLMRPKGGPAFSQEEINAMVQSARFVGPEK